MAHSTPQQFKYVDENVPFFHPRPRRHFDTNLGVVEDEILNMLDGSPRPRQALGPVHRGPTVPPTTQLNAVLDQHASEMTICANLMSPRKVYTAPLISRDQPR
jgi:hypothetical protein